MTRTRCSGHWLVRWALACSLALPCTSFAGTDSPLVCFFGRSSGGFKVDVGIDERRVGKLRGGRAVCFQARAGSRSMHAWRHSKVDYPVSVQEFRDGLLIRENRPGSIDLDLEGGEVYYLSVSMRIPSGPFGYTVYALEEVLAADFWDMGVEISKKSQFVPLPVEPM